MDLTDTVSAAPSGLLTPSAAVPEGQGLFSVTERLGACEGRAWRFTVFGEAKSAGSKRAFRHPHTGRLIVTEAVKGSKDWRAAVAATVAGEFDGELLDGPLEVVMTFYRPRPRSHYGSGRNSGLVKGSAPAFPCTRPDVLKLARGVEDSCTGVLWTDDARVVDEVLRKRWGHPARLELEVREL